MVNELKKNKKKSKMSKKSKAILKADRNFKHQRRSVGKKKANAPAAVRPQVQAPKANKIIKKNLSTRSLHDVDGRPPTKSSTHSGVSRTTGVTSNESSITLSKTCNANENDQSQEMKPNFANHINKIRVFIHHQLKNEILNGEKIFDSINGILPKNGTRAAFDANIEKSRHPDVICADQGRVMLNGNKGFVHANRVPISEDGTGELILTQLPLKSTVMDFWRMVWDENVQSVLVILTQNEWNYFGRKLRLVPDWRGCLHKRNGLCIAFQQEYTVSPVWSVTFYGLSWGGVHRCIQWIHYTDWAHRQAPNDTTAIWQINSYLRRSKRPIICMSMTGIGRAGAYAMLEVAHERIHNQKIKHIDLVECLQKVRDTRMHALQTRVQFNFVQLALTDHLLASDKIRMDLKADYLIRYKKLRTLKLNQRETLANGGAAIGFDHRHKHHKECHAETGSTAGITVLDLLVDEKPPKLFYGVCELEYHLSEALTLSQQLDTTLEAIKFISGTRFPPIDSYICKVNSVRSGLEEIYNFVMEQQHYTTRMLHNPTNHNVEQDESIDESADISCCPTDCCECCNANEGEPTRPRTYLQNEHTYRRLQKPTTDYETRRIRIEKNWCYHGYVDTTKKY